MLSAGLCDTRLKYVLCSSQHAENVHFPNYHWVKQHTTVCLMIGCLFSNSQPVKTTHTSINLAQSC